MNKNDLVELTANINQYSCPNEVNFHCHTIFSDGSLNPEEILDQAYENNLKYLSITDHNTLNAHKYIHKQKLLKKYPKDSFKLITGIEINCILKGCLVHVLGLGLDLNSKFLIPYTNGESAYGEDLKASSVAKAITLAGGISFLAHPARYRLPFNILIPEAFYNGINGVEVWYDYSLKKIWEPSNFICNEIDKLTNNYKMLKTCGTDSHGYSLFGR